MDFCLWIIGILHFLGSPAAHETPRESLAFDAAQIQVPQIVEATFKAHCFSLVGVANIYEREKKPTVLTHVYQHMGQKTLVELLKESQLQINEICQADEVQKTFRQAQGKSKADFNTRLSCWKEFVNKLYEEKQDARKKDTRGVVSCTREWGAHKRIFGTKC